MSGTGHAGMEATIANLVEPGETVVVGNKGIWGMRVADLAARYGANVVEMTTGGAPRSFSLEEIKSAVETHKPALLFLCQGESSMGASFFLCFLSFLLPVLHSTVSVIIRASLKVNC